MRRRDKGQKNERLRDLLRSEDPATDSSDPTAEELAVWKRDMLNSAARGPRWQTELTWAVATGVAVAFVALLLFFLIDRQETSTGSRLVVTELLHTTEESAQQDAQPGPLATQEPPADTVLITPPGPVALPARMAPVPAAARTIQFTTPKGTRIIWTLDPEFSLPDTGETT